MNIKRRICALIALLLLLLTGCEELMEFVYNEYLPKDEEVIVSFIDVGQADAALLQSANGAVLIDGGETDTSDELVEYLKSRGVDSLDVVVATHPHSDHIGGLPSVLNAIPVQRVIMPDATHTTRAFERLLDAIEQNDIPVTQAMAGETFDIGDMEFLIVAPNSEEYEDLNNYSVVMKMTYGYTSFLFTGDAEKESEDEMINAGVDLSADVLKVGHHGSSTSTTRQFLSKVNPTFAVISCGEDNSYGHPHKKTLDTLSDLNAEVYRTDMLGTIVITTDGVNITVDHN